MGDCEVLLLQFAASVLDGESSIMAGSDRNSGEVDTSDSQLMVPGLIQTIAECRQHFQLNESLGFLCCVVTLRREVASLSYTTSCRLSNPSYPSLARIRTTSSRYRYSPWRRCVYVYTRIRHGSPITFAEMIEDMGITSW
jgi:hypothetical protein